MTPAFAIWITGLPASGKSTIARALAARLQGRGVDVVVLESDALRKVLTPHPTYSEDERTTFYRAMSYVGTLLVEHGIPVVFDATANRRAYRDAARTTIARFVEVFVDTPLAECMRRDPKGLYRRAQSGLATSVPGAQVVYERPDNPDVVVSGVTDSAERAADVIVRDLERRRFLDTHGPTP
jgi:adenylylsulfate kinase